MKHHNSSKEVVINNNLPASSISSSKKEKDVLDHINLTDIIIRKRIAILYQTYIALSLLSCVPDRQRTFRELRIDETFIKETEIINNKIISYWCIKHGPDDYKTGLYLL